MITIGVFAKQKILKEALCSMLESNDEFSAVAVTSDISGLAEEIKESQFTAQVIKCPETEIRIICISWNHYNINSG